MFSDAEVAKIVASRSESGLIIKLKSSHIIGYKNIKRMEDTVNKEVFNPMKKEARIEMIYELSSLYTPKKLWDIVKKDIYSEIRELSHIFYAVLLSTEIEVTDTDEKKAKMIFRLAKDYFNEKGLDFIKDYLEKKFSDEFGYELEFERNILIKRKRKRRL